MFKTCRKTTFDFLNLFFSQNHRLTSHKNIHVGIFQITADNLEPYKKRKCMLICHQCETSDNHSDINIPANSCYHLTPHPGRGTIVSHYKLTLE